MSEQAQTEPPVHCLHETIEDPAALVPTPNNPNDHPEPQVDALGKLIEGLGWRRCLVVSKESGRLVVGHGARLAAIKRGWKVPVQRQSFASPELEYAFVCADNFIAEQAQTNFETLKAGLLQLPQGFDLTLTGLPKPDIDQLLAATFSVPAVKAGNIASAHQAGEEVTFTATQFATVKLLVESFNKGKGEPQTVAEVLVTLCERTLTIGEEARQLCYLIEAIPASEQQTAASVAAAALSQKLHA